VEVRKALPPAAVKLLSHDPHSELSTLMLAVGDALDLAEASQVANGYMILLQGLQRASDADEAGEKWGEELRQRYQTAADDFAQQDGLGRA
jgi:hypothetical protein